jgi:hypothetical protein
MRATTSLALFTLVIATPLAAQDKEKLCNDIQNRPMRVGQWASYRWIGGSADGTTMRMAVVGTEPVAGTPYYWYEMSITDPQKGVKGRTVIQMLVPELGFGAGSGGPRGMIMKSGDDPATRMPDEMVQMMGGRMAGQNFAAEIARRCRDMVVVGWEQVAVPAGSFRALHIKSADEKTEAWIVPDLYFGMVKATMHEGSMQLTARGTDGKSSITETPRMMPH